jgi:hypothetical protein
MRGGKESQINGEYIGGRGRRRAEERRKVRGTAGWTVVGAGRGGRRYKSSGKVLDKSYRLIFNGFINGCQGERGKGVRTCF